MNSIISLRLYSYTKALIANKSRRASAIKTILLLIPVFVYGMGLLRSGNNLAPGDADYYTQLYEATRRSIVEFHQIPWWNPWMSGGIPLFANPQFGPISIQLVTTLFFGSILGYKIALVLYLAIGFFGMRRLLVGVYRSNRLHATLLSYIWIFSSFFVYRAGGHFTFFVIGFVPWIIYYFIKRNEGINWLWFALMTSALIWSSLHYTTIIAFLIIAFFGLGDVVESFLSWLKQKKRPKMLNYMSVGLGIKKLFYAALIIFFISLPKLYATFEFSHDYPRIVGQFHEHTTPTDITLYALFSPDQYSHPPTEYVMWSWMETSSYIGILTFFVLLIVLTIFVQRDTKRSFKVYWLLALVVLCLLLARADFASWSPFTLLRELPVFSSMRVATRWIAWAALFILIFIGSVKIKNKRLFICVTIMMLLTVMELMVVGFKNIDDSYKIQITKKSDGAQIFSQRSMWHTKRSGIEYDENFTEATRNNIGQVIAGDSLIDTRAAVKTVRCDETDPNCKFVSSNAILVSWSPNKIVLRRTDVGPIALDMNVGSYWRVNGEYVFKDNMVVDTTVPFVIYTQDKDITVDYKPLYSPLDVVKRVLR